MSRNKKAVVVESSIILIQRMILVVDFGLGTSAFATVTRGFVLVRVTTFVIIQDTNSFLLANITSSNQCAFWDLTPILSSIMMVGQSLLKWC